MKAFIRTFVIFVALLTSPTSFARHHDPMPPEETTNGQALEEGGEEEAEQNISPVIAEYDEKFPFIPTPALVENRCWPESVRKKSGRSACWTLKYDEYAKEVLTDTSPFLTVDAVPEGMEEICPNYKFRKTKEERRRFWLYFLQALAAMESTFDTSLEMPNPENRKNIPAGLLQLSANTDSHIPGCKGIAGKGVFNARNNIKCALTLLRLQLYKKVGDDQWELNKPLWGYNERKKSTKPYWSPLWKTPGASACLSKIPGYNPKRPQDLSRVPEDYRANVLGCEGYNYRRIFSQFWEDYPPNNDGSDLNLCGRKNILEMCGMIPTCVKDKPKRGKREKRPTS